jgi:CDP-glucose 4,6-dehydratase
VSDRAGGSLRATSASRAGGPTLEFWRDRRVLVTGHTGFKGSWLSLWLHALGAKVTGYALEPPTTPSLYNQACVGDVVSSITGDVRDAPRLAAAVADVGPQVVLHLAAQSVVKRGYANPVETYSTNVMGTVNLFEALRAHRAPCVVVNVTSDKCYAHRTRGPAYREDDPMGGDDPYSNSKGCSELITDSYRRSFFPPERLEEHGVALASARAGNAIGGGDWTANQLVPDLIRSFVAGEKCLIRSPGGIRPWQFVLEPVRGYLLLAERLAESGAQFMSGWNFGPVDSDAKPVSWIADRLSRAWSRNAAWTTDGSAHPPEAPVLRLDASKAATSLGWRPMLPLDGALDWIVEWYSAWTAGGALGDVTRSQISRYERMLAA